MKKHPFVSKISTEKKNFRVFLFSYISPSCVPCVESSAEASAQRPCHETPRTRGIRLPRHCQSFPHLQSGWSTAKAQSARALHLSQMHNPMLNPTKSKNRLAFVNVCNLPARVQLLLESCSSVECPEFFSKLQQLQLESHQAERNFFWNPIHSSLPCCVLEMSQIEIRSSDQH